MFFFIGGIQPKKVELDSSPRACPSCGLLQAKLKRVDHYLSLFFIPLFPVKKGAPFLECENCGSLSHESGEPWFKTSRVHEMRCPKCGGLVESTFRYCPACGTRISRGLL
ncbi:MAG: zinc ribbon domain-containing protein [Deltaproteobacteria bacterium]|nr:zinc ribbon domain-containing protein [Deltaproteobacteria bacterium]MBW2137746.1 zinc ribbon domain-containing protein [Deltaproteobacteria bacterium]